MDILTTLLLFVLMSFVAGGDAQVPPPGLQLPKSTAEDEMQASLVVAIDDDAILVGSERIASVDEAVADPGLVIEPLAARLREARRTMDEIAGRRGETPAEAQAVTIQGDRDIEFRVLQKVMYTLNQNGFDRIALAVVRES
jgi:biopolymer transport protein ExbD